jgi:hypothetical protein
MKSKLMLSLRSASTRLSSEEEKEEEKQSKTIIRLRLKGL